MHGVRGACPSLVGSMQNWEWSLACARFPSWDLLIRGGRRSKFFRLFPAILFLHDLCLFGSTGMYLVYWLTPQAYPLHIGFTI